MENTSFLDAPGATAKGFGSVTKETPASLLQKWKDLGSTKWNQLRLNESQKLLRDVSILALSDALKDD